VKLKELLNSVFSLLCASWF